MGILEFGSYRRVRRVRSRGRQNSEEMGARRVRVANKKWSASRVAPRTSATLWGRVAIATRQRCHRACRARANFVYFQQKGKSKLKFILLRLNFDLEGFGVRDRRSVYYSSQRNYAIPICEMLLRWRSVKEVNVGTFWPKFLHPGEHVWKCLGIVKNWWETEHKTSTAISYAERHLSMNDGVASSIASCQLLAARSPFVANDPETPCIYMLFTSYQLLLSWYQAPGTSPVMMVMVIIIDFFI